MKRCRFQTGLLGVLAAALCAACVPGSVRQDAWGELGDGAVGDANVVDSGPGDAAVPGDARIADTRSSPDGFRPGDAAGFRDGQLAFDAHSGVDASVAPDGSRPLPFPSGLTSQVAEPRRIEGVVVDGLLQEWGESNALLISPDNVLSNGGVGIGIQDNNDASATVALAYDGDYLYVAARVVDDDRDVDGNAADAPWFFYDSIAFFFDLDHDPYGSTFRDGDNLFAFRATPDQSGRARWWHQGHDSGAVGQAAPAEVLSALRLTEQGYDLEAAIPWTLISANNWLRFAQSFGFTMVLVDPQGSSINRLVWVGSEDNDNQANWGRMVLQDYVDDDQDGWPAETDCMDAFADVHPYAMELSGNNRDDDCDGERDEVVSARIWDRQREPSFAEGDVSIVGNRFQVGGVDYYPKTDFLTAVAPGTDIIAYTTHCYLSQNASRQRAIRQALTASGYNAIYLYTLNQGDYRGGSNVVTPYGTGGFSFDVNQLNAATIAAWQSEIESLIYEHQLKPFLWLAADDSGAIASASMSTWRAYVDHMIAAFDGYPILWVLGLEVDEYWSSAQVAERRAYVQSQTRHPVGVHLTINETRNTGSAYKDGFDFILVQFGSPQSNSRYVSDTNAYTSTDRPYIAAEFNVSGRGSGGEAEGSVTARSQAIGAVIAGVGQPSRVSGIGNGIRLPAP